MLGEDLLSHEAFTQGLASSNFADLSMVRSLGKVLSNQVLRAAFSDDISRIPNHQASH